MAKYSLTEARQRTLRVDEARLDATTEDEIRAHQIEDGYDPDFEPASVRVVHAPQEIRLRLAMTQDEFAAELSVPLATVKEWETGRSSPTTTARNELDRLASGLSPAATRRRGQA
ncbi:helix-turn-helix domain-containing protein [Methylobacterium oryzihabitans]|uniref:Helix-turn-helix domain-containing protein n=1 Tax=Methylobacterium oryzihabitans TaxID=2499852 RepID=A0A3S2VFD2_9HYPH|nr:helix-turn-helix domain-containing protein [Methylobacterium oryzihabitans]RVU21758.1 helix-turn-helix domain-containing protein [Methylobacterium oryzihabitans]